MKEKIKYVLVTIFLGAIGSGIWSYAGEPLLKWCAAKYIDTAQLLNHSYNDYLHSEIGRAFILDAAYNSSGGSTLTLAMFMAVVAVVIVSTIRVTPSRETVRLTGYLVFTLLILAMVLLLQALATSIKNGYTRNAIVFIERSIEILTPRIESTEVAEFRASYRAIETAKDFYILHDQLIKRGNDLNVKLPEFDIAR